MKTREGASLGLGRARDLKTVHLALNVAKLLGRA